MRTVAKECPKTSDRRAESTREQIMQGFTALVFADGFESVSVRKIVETAGIARSTFYEHFANKEDVLRACMDRFFSAIADSVSADGASPELHRALEHLWSNRRLTDAIFSGHARAILLRNQVDLVEMRLRRAAAAGTALPLRLAAVQIAGGQMALVEAWLRGGAFCSPGELAQGLACMSRAAAAALWDTAR